MHHLGSSLNLKTVSHFWHDFSLSSQKLTSPPRNPSVITCQIRRASETPLTCELYDATQTIKQNTYLILPGYISCKLKFKNNCNFSEVALQNVFKIFSNRMKFFILQKILHFLPLCCSWFLIRRYTFMIPSCHFDIFKNDGKKLTIDSTRYFFLQI